MPARRAAPLLPVLARLRVEVFREAHARAVSDCAYAIFCAVRRPDGHPLKPPGSVSLDGFWRRRFALSA